MNVYLVALLAFAGGFASGIFVLAYYVEREMKRGQAKTRSKRDVT